jgi:hypothetical protein
MIRHEEPRVHTSDFGQSAALKVTVRPCDKADITWSSLPPLFPHKTITADGTPARTAIVQLGADCEEE